MYSDIQAYLAEKDKVNNKICYKFCMGFTCRLLTAKSRSATGESHHPAFMVSRLAIGQTRLSCPPCGTIEGSGKVQLVCASRLLGMGGDSLLMQRRGVGGVDRQLLLLALGGCLTIIKVCLSCRMLTAETWNVRGAYCQPASTGGFLNICQPCLSCPHLVDRCGYNVGLCSGN